MATSSCFTTLAKEAREKALSISGFRCEKCGANENLKVHHKDHNRLNNKPENLVVLCASCHRASHAKRPIPASVTLPRECLQWIDRKVEARIYANRSHAIEVLILGKIKEEKGSE